MPSPISTKNSLPLKSNRYKLGGFISLLHFISSSSRAVGLPLPPLKTTTSSRLILCYEAYFFQGKPLYTSQVATLFLVPLHL